MSFDKTLALKLQEAFDAERNKLPDGYNRAVSDCDEAWSGVEGALSNKPLRIGLVVDAILDFRIAYAPQARFLEPSHTGPGRMTPMLQFFMVLSDVSSHTQFRHPSRESARTEAGRQILRSRISRSLRSQQSGDMGTARRHSVLVHPRRCVGR